MVQREAFIKSYIESQDGNEIVFSWQGGELTLLGLDYFKKIVELQNNAKRGVRIENDLQTNGLLLNEAWCMRSCMTMVFWFGLSINSARNLSTINIMGLKWQTGVSTRHTSR